MSELCNFNPNIKITGKNEFLKTILEIPEEMKACKHWTYAMLPGKEFIKAKNKSIQIPGKKPCNKTGYNINSNDSKNWLGFKKVFLDNPFELYHAFHLNEKFICIDLDGAYGEDGQLYLWAKDIISQYDKSKAYIEKSVSGKGIHIITPMTQEYYNKFQAAGKIINNGASKKTKEISIQLNKTHKQAKGYPDKCKVEIFINRIIVLTGKYLFDTKCTDFQSDIKPDLKVLDQVVLLRKNTWINKVETNKEVKDIANKKGFDSSDSINTMLKKDSDIENIFNYLKFNITIGEVLDQYGAQSNTGGNISCILPGHEDSAPSMKIYESTNSFNCWACRKGGSIIDLVMAMENYKSPLEAAKKLNSMFDIGIKFTKKLDGAAKAETLSNEHLKQVVKQGADISDLLNEGKTCLPWIKTEYNANTGNTTTKVIVGVLAEYLEKTLEYIFIQPTPKSSVQMFLYTDSYYKQCNVNDFTIEVKKYIPVTLVTKKLVQDVLYLLLSTDSFKHIDQLNPEKYINFNNGLFNVETWELEQHTPEVYTTIRIPCNYNPEATKPESSVFDRYINTLTDNKEDIKDLLLSFMGMTISNLNGGRLKKSLFMTGAGDTGKSQIKELLIKIIGNHNADTSDLSAYEARFGTSAIFNKRLIGSNDAAFMAVRELKIFKQFTSNDTIAFEFKNEGVFSGKFTGISWFCCNQLPKFGGDKGDWVYNRIIVVECNNVIPEEKQDKNLVNKMFAEREYIINSILPYVKQILEAGYKIKVPKQCELSREAYKTENNSFLQFIDECVCAREGKFGIRKADFYRFYTQWAYEHNNRRYAEPKKEINQILKDKKMDLVTKDSTGNRVYKDIMLTKECIQDYYTAVERAYPTGTKFGDTSSRFDILLADIVPEDHRQIDKLPEQTTKVPLRSCDKDGKNIVTYEYDLNDQDKSKFLGKIFIDKDDKVYIPEFKDEFVLRVLNSNLYDSLNKKVLFNIGDNVFEKARKNNQVSIQDSYIETALSTCRENNAITELLEEIKTEPKQLESFNNEAKKETHLNPTTVSNILERIF